MFGTASEKVPNPVQPSSPTKISAPTPAASRPGTRMTPSIGPPRPDTSISRNAPTSGEPSSVLIAAKLPATPLTATAWAGAPRRTRWIAQAPRPLPMAISGASGPSTAPKASVTKAASATPGSSNGRVAPGLKPSAGRWPPMPGSSRMARATSSPPTARTGMGHQLGWLSKPRSAGRSLKRNCWASATTFRKKNATAATGTPRPAPKTSAPR